MQQNHHATIHGEIAHWANNISSQSMDKKVQIPETILSDQATYYRSKGLEKFCKPNKLNSEPVQVTTPLEAVLVIR